jgi:magnesium-transporting ATPase (P-type)
MSSASSPISSGGLYGSAATSTPKTPSRPASVLLSSSSSLSRPPSLGAGGTPSASALLSPPPQQPRQTEPLSLENTLWANTVVATGQAIGIVVYTGAECRSAMNAHAAAVKTGKLDLEVNSLTKLLFAFTIALAATIVGFKGFTGSWYTDFFRFVLIFSSIIPISLRVNLDMSKILSSYLMSNDALVPGTTVRNTSIPEDLGRVDYLFSDKTGTLTKNHMLFQKLALSAQLAYDVDSLPLLREHCAMAAREQSAANLPLSSSSSSSSLSLGAPSALGAAPVTQATLRAARTAHRALTAIAVCHNVTPVIADAATMAASAASAHEADALDSHASSSSSHTVSFLPDFSALHSSPTYATIPDVALASPTMAALSLGHVVG